MKHDPARITFRFAHPDDAEGMKYLYMATRERAKNKDEYSAGLHFKVKGSAVEDSVPSGQTEFLLAIQGKTTLGYIAYQTHNGGTDVKVNDICTLRNDKTAAILFAKLCKMKTNARHVYMVPTPEMKNTCEELFLTPDLHGGFSASEQTLESWRNAPSPLIAA